MVGQLLSNPIIATILWVIGALVVIIAAILSTWKKVPSDKAAVIVGLGKAKVVTGGGCVVIPIIQRIDYITLENILLDVKINKTKTSLGVPINAEGVVVLKVKNDEASILAAVQQFNCCNEKLTVDTIRNQSSEICKGKLREIVSTMTVEKIYDDRQDFSVKVQSVAGKELGEMGLELKSFTINDITDDEGYIEALGKEQIAKVKSVAAIAEAEAAKEKQIKTSEALRAGETAKLESETKIAEAAKIKNLKVLEFQREQEAKRAESDAAYTIQQNITSKEVTNTEMDAQVLREQRGKEVREAEIQIEIVAEQKRTELAQRKAERKQAELQETVIRPAEAEKQKKQLDADARKYEEIAQAEANAAAKKLDASAQAEHIKQEGLARAEVTQRQGEAQAESIRLLGLAEAEALEKKAEALAKMNDAGKLQMVIEKLPEIARAVSEPMSKIGNITIIGGGSANGDGAVDVARYTVGAMKAVSDAMKETIGFDLTEIMRANTYDAKTTRNVNISMDDMSDDINKRQLLNALITEEIASEIL